MAERLLLPAGLIGMLSPLSAFFFTTSIIVSAPWSWPGLRHFYSGIPVPLASLIVITHIVSNTPWSSILITMYSPSFSEHWSSRIPTLPMFETSCKIGKKKMNPRYFLSCQNSDPKCGSVWPVLKWNYCSSVQQLLDLKSNINSISFTYRSWKSCECHGQC